MPGTVKPMAEPGGYFDAYPCAARLGNGDLLIAFSRRPLNSATDVRAWICGIRSSDDGRTWSSPSVLIDTPEMLDYDPNIVAWEDRVVVISTTVPKTHGVQVTTSTFLAVRSEDWGQTWSGPVEIPHPPYVYCSGKIHPGVRFPDGTLAFGYSPDMRIQEGVEVHKDGDSWGTCALMVSRDDGRTWEGGAMVGIREERASELTHAINGLDEPALAVCRDGGVYMLMRTGFERLYEARSQDQGRTWSAATPTSFVAHNSPADLCVFEHPRLGRGWLAVYDDSPRLRTPLAVRVSLDEGRTWSSPKIIAREGTPSYPTCVQTGAGDILLAWHEVVSAGGDEPGAHYEIRACLLEPDEIEEMTA